MSRRFEEAVCVDGQCFAQGGGVSSTHLFLLGRIAV